MLRYVLRAHVQVGDGTRTGAAARFTDRDGPAGAKAGIVTANDVITATRTNLFMMSLRSSSAGLLPARAASGGI